MVKIGVLGGTGGIGRIFVKLGLEAGHTMVVLARSPAKVEEVVPVKGTPLADRLQVIEGDCTNAANVASTVEGCDVVVSMAGGPKMLEKTAENLLAAKPKRFLFITSLGCGGSSGCIKFILSLIVGFSQFADVEAADAIVRAAQCPYVLVRPDGLADGNPRGKVKATEEGGVGMGDVKRADVAKFLLDCVTDTQWDGKAVQLYQ
mmetsp:Transcript_36020/g.84301  ORF Transcript_36020/g.84301 Transcript_36020/m.84301 type:complete len:204 (-) Transcript_36020:521-1132(-)